MISKFQAKQFRGLPDLELGDLRRITIIGGKNNVGKTSALEALYLLLSTNKPDALMALNFARAILGFNLTYEIIEEYFWRPLFRHLDTHKPIELRAVDTVGGEYSTQIVVDPNTSVVGDVPGKFHPALRCTYNTPGLPRTETDLFFQEGRLLARSQSTDVMHPNRGCSYLASGNKPTYHETAERFGNLELRGGIDFVLEALRHLEPDLISLRTIVRAGIPMIWAELKQKTWVPAYFLGEGSVRLAMILMSILDTRDGVVLVDEFENGIHHSVMDKAWEAIREACHSANVQLIVPTHSLEAVTSAERVFLSTPQQFRYLRMERSGEGIVVKSYDHDVLDTAIDMNLEVR